MLSEHTIICRGTQGALTVKEFCEYTQRLLQSLSEVGPELKFWAVARPSTNYSVIEVLDEHLTNMSSVLFEELEFQSKKHPGDFFTY